MRNAFLDRLRGSRGRGMRRTVVAGWAVVFVLFGLFLAGSSLAGKPAGGPPTVDRAISSLVIRAVPQRDACDCVDFDLEMQAAPALC